MIKRFFLVLVAVLVFPAATHAATLTLGGPSAVKVGDVFNVPVLLSTTMSANAVSGTVSYPSDLLTLVSLSKAGSIITLWPTDPSVGSGTADFGGIILNPGWSGIRGTVVTMTFQAKAAGTAALTFSGDAAVLANDGNATPILSGTSPASITIAPGAPAPATAPVKTPTKKPTEALAPAKEATSTPVPAPTPAVTRHVIEPIVPEPQELSFSSFVRTVVFPNALEIILALLLIFLAWHRYERGVPPFYFTFEGKAPMTPPKPEVLLQQFDKLHEAITLEALSIQKIKEGQPLTEEEQRFLALFKKLMNVVEG